MTTDRRTSTSTRPARRAVIGVLLAGLLTLPACSHDDDQDATDLVADAQAQAYAQERAEQRQVQQANAALPDRPAGRVDIDGAGTVSLTTGEVQRYLATGTDDDVELAASGEAAAFRRLCAGQTDLVSSLRPLSRSEWEACRSVGLDVVQLQIASDAVVVAIASESDVGGDCLTTDQVREIWRAGSPVTDWRQLGLDDVRLKVGGPRLGSADFNVFGTSVLGSPAPALTDVRSDYAAYADFDHALRFLNGGRARIRRATTYADRARLRGQRRSELESARQVDLAARQELRAARAERAKGIRDGRSNADQAKDRARLDAAQHAAAVADTTVNRARSRYRTATRLARSAAEARQSVQRTRGHVIYARFSDYEVFEDQLRPFEITLPDGRRNCVFPSQRTITGGEYPFASQMLLTTTTRSLARTEVKDFLDHYLRASQDAAVAARLVPLPDETLRTQLAWVAGSQTPPLVAPDGAGTTTTTDAGPDPAEPAR